MRARSDGKLRGNEKHLRYWADVIVELRADGTYRIVKDMGRNFAPRDETIFGIQDARKLKLPEFAIMPGRMSGDVFERRIQ